MKTAWRGEGRAIDGDLKSDLKNARLMGSSQRRDATGVAKNGVMQVTSKSDLKNDAYRA